MGEDIYARLVVEAYASGVFGVRRDLDLTYLRGLAVIAMVASDVWVEELAKAPYEPGEDLDS